MSCEALNHETAATATFCKIVEKKSILSLSYLEQESQITVIVTMSPKTQLFSGKTVCQKYGLVRLWGLTDTCWARVV